MTRSRIEDLVADLDLDDDDDQPVRRETGMEREQSDFDPATLVAELGPRDGAAGTPATAASSDSIGGRPEWHSANPPAAVAAAWAAVEEAIGAAVDADRNERAIDAEEAQAQRVESARVRSAVASGKVVKASPGPDWAAQRRHLSSVAAGYRLLAAQKRGTYDALVLEHQPTWAARIVEGLPDEKAKALAALSEAGNRVERLLAAALAAQSLLIEEGGSVVALPTVAVRQFVEHAQALASEVEGSAPLAGEGLCHARMTPSWRDREQLAAGVRHGAIGDGSAHWLAELERREGYKLSSFTRGVPLGPKPSESATW